jgi:hypothetical protein
MGLFDSYTSLQQAVVAHSSDVCWLRCVTLERMPPGLGMQWWERGPKVVGGLPLVWVAEAVLAAVVQVRRRNRCLCLI